MRTNDDVLGELNERQVARFWTKVSKGPAGDCWMWTGAVHPRGYGTWTVTRPDRRQTSLRPHRVAWHLVVGPIPSGMTIDHLCRTRLCVNPEHLEVVTHDVNMARIESFRPAFPKVVRAVLSRGWTEGEVVSWLRAWDESGDQKRGQMERALFGPAARSEAA